MLAGTHSNEQGPHVHLSPARLASRTVACSLKHMCCDCIYVVACFGETSEDVRLWIVSIVSAREFEIRCYNRVTRLRAYNDRQIHVCGSIIDSSINTSGGSFDMWNSF